MKKVRFTELGCQSGAVFVFLGEGKNISRVDVKLSGVDGRGTVRVRYAQSGVLDVLLHYGKQKINECVSFASATPVSATHVFVSLADTEARVEEIIVFEAEEGEGVLYPHAVDTDLGGIHRLDALTVKASTAAELLYAVYTSTDGQNYTFLGERRYGAPDPTGDVYACDGREARYVRVLVIYHAADPYLPPVSVSFEGELLDKPAPKPLPISVPDFADTPYAAPITEAETVEVLYGIVERRLGAAYKAWFDFSIVRGEGRDFFCLSDGQGRIKIEGSCGTVVAAGLNYYLKHYCKVHLSQVGDQVKMPASPIPVGGRVRRETKSRVRFAYNACVHSYTMAFWGEEEWQKEIDLLALSGVNVVLDTTAVEEVWRRFLGALGYTHAEVKDFLSGPAYYAWQWIGNQTGQGGPLPDVWFERRTALARRNHRMMRTLGMEVVLPGYSGMVPVDISSHDPDVKVIPQGTWSAFTRPGMLHPSHPSFDRYAVLYYEILEKVFGKNRYFTDTLFHEGGNRADLSERTVAAHMLELLLKVNPDAVWVITSWQRNPSSELLAGIEKEKKHHALVLDLYGEKLPNYVDGKEGNRDHGYTPEFDGTPWVLCMLSNFGGRQGLHGHLDNLVKGIPAAFNNTHHCAGVGMVPEASENNPVLYDFLFDAIWQEDADKPLAEVDIKAWLHDYAERRYGIKAAAAESAWDILADTVYLAASNMKGQGAPESVTNARPALTIKAASTWGNAVIDYDKARLVEAYHLLLGLRQRAKTSGGYLYDLAALGVQVLANEAQDVHAEMARAFEAKDKEAFALASDHFLALIKEMDEAASVSPYFRLDRWTGMAEKLAENTDDLTRRIFLYNARALITTWGSYYPSEVGLLHDYSNRTWSGMLGGLYRDRWARWISDRKREMNGENVSPVNWFEMEWKWIWS